MNKVKVGNAPPPNLRVVKSKIGSLQNATHKPGGGNVKIEHKKLEFNVQSKIAAKNDNYAPGGGDKKVPFQSNTLCQPLTIINYFFVNKCVILFSIYRF